jgi:hypothetical protein
MEARQKRAVEKAMMKRDGGDDDVVVVVVVDDSVGESGRQVYEGYEGYEVEGCGYAQKPCWVGRVQGRCDSASGGRDWVKR